MSMSMSTSSVYIHVIEDVIGKVRGAFLGDNGPGDIVLNELQAIWEMKMIQAGAICTPIERSTGPKSVPGGLITAVHDLNVPYEGTEEYETPTAEMLFPPTPLQTPIQTPLPGSVQTPLPVNVDNSPMYNIPTGPIGEHPPIFGGPSGNMDSKTGRPSTYMHPPSPWMSQRPPFGVDVNVAYVEGRDEGDKRNSQQPMTQDFFMMSSGKRKREDLPTQYNNGRFIAQEDGAGDLPYQVLEIYNNEGIVSEDYHIADTSTINDLHENILAIDQQHEVGDEDDETLNEGDDDDDLDDVDDGEEMNTQHLVLAQFEKVTRTKSRWKCTLKDGIVHINNKDILFNKASGEFDF